VKNQYFGDQRDFLKYDLLADLAEHTPGVSRLTIIPMLTPHDGTREGNVVAYDAGRRRPDIFHFLRYCLARNDRDIRNLRTLFQGRDYAFHCHRDGLHYSHEARLEYFASVPDRSLLDAVVFVDPDTGIETGTVPYMQGAGISRYLFWPDITSLFGRMSESSVLVVYQHLQRNASLVVGDMQGKSLAMCGHLRVPAVLLCDDGDVAYLITSRAKRVWDHLARSLPIYAETHGLRFHSVSNDLAIEEGDG